jgi:hypothetical protein
MIEAPRAVQITAHEAVLDFCSLRQQIDELFAIVDVNLPRV